MKHLEYSIRISAGKQKVWNTMLQPETYREWVDTSWPGSFYQGKWAAGESLRFLSPQGGGTMAEVTEMKLYEAITARHVAVINPDGTEDRDSETAKGWIGSTERYTFAEANGKTTLTVSVDTPPAWVKMFDEGWPAALEKLKEIAER